MKTRVKAGAAALCVFGLGLISGQALGKEPQLQAALGFLNSTENLLHMSSSDRSGHRARALELVQQAKLEIRAGMAVDEEL